MLYAADAGTFGSPRQRTGDNGSARRTDTTMAEKPTKAEVGSPDLVRPPGLLDRQPVLLGCALNPGRGVGRDARVELVQVQREYRALRVLAEPVTEFSE